MGIFGENKMGNQPIKKFNAGLLSVCIWKNEVTTRFGGKHEFRTVSVSRGYKDKSGEFKSSNSFRPEDLGAIKELLTEAEDFLNGDSREMEEEIVIEGD